ncbi:MAG: hypothetical protein BWX99_01752 [Deltaproteobacteria bacterium ADurb.Bin151]|nr:MAG: hypothetical protein BWX99_01752 [Deltaproteobacteria bacterium ADurb.Bin151]
MGVDIVITNHILNALGNEPENIQVLFSGKLFDRQRARHKFHLGHQAFRGNPLQFKCGKIKPQVDVNFDNRTFGDELQIQGLNQLFKQHTAQALQAQDDSHRVEFFLVIGPVHGRNARRNMTFMIDILKGLCFLFRKYPGFQHSQEFQDQCQAAVVIFNFQRPPQRHNVLYGKNIDGFQVFEQIEILGIIFLMDQLIDTDH